VRRSSATPSAVTVPACGGRACDCFARGFGRTRHHARCPHNERGIPRRARFNLRFHRSSKHNSCSGSSRLAPSGSVPPKAPNQARAEIVQGALLRLTLERHGLIRYITSMNKEPPETETAFGSWEQRARLLRTIAHPIRLVILKSLCEGPRCVTDINALIAIAQPRLSHYIAALREARLIDRYVNGCLCCYYLLKPTLVDQLMRLISTEHLERERATVVRKAQRRRGKRGPNQAPASHSRG